MKRIVIVAAAAVAVAALGVGVTVGSTHQEHRSGPTSAPQTLPPGLTAAPQDGQMAEQMCDQAAQRLRVKHPGAFVGECNHGESTLPVP